MKRYHKNPCLWDYMHTKRAIVAMIIFLVFAVGWLIDSVELVTQSYQAYSTQAGTYTELTNRQAVLEAQVAQIRSAHGIEEIVRERFDVAREGEEVFIIVDREAPEAPVEKQSWFDTLFSL
jgi:cell division protein FtsB